jgi:tripartite-type tricarboxylate transporter receptor subunit TctC
MNSFRRSLVAGAVALGLLGVPLAHAQDAYPSKPIRMVLGFSAGGISDVLGRTLAAKISSSLGQQIVVENKPGAGGTVAADLVAKSPPDGYTIWLQDMTAHAINATMYRKLPYDSLKDFTPITLVAFTPLVLVVHPDQPAKNVQQLVAYLKANEGKANYASAGSGTANQIAAELLKRSANVPDVVHVPYKGSTPSAQAVLANEVNFSFLSMPPAVSNIAAGKMRGLAVTSAKRIAAIGDVPTMIESGFPGFELVVYSGILAPAGTPKAVVDKLHAEFVKAVNSEDVKTAFSKIGAETITNTPDEMRRMMEADIARLAPVVKASGATID